MSNKQLQDKISELSHLVKTAKGKLDEKEKCIPIMLIVGAIVPIVVWLALYFIQPAFVKVQEGSKQVRSNTKVFYWTVIITVVAWVAMYLWAWCQGYDQISMLCARI